MRRLSTTASCLAVLGLTAAAGYNLERFRFGRSVTALGPNEEVVVSFRDFGCFHRLDVKLRFSGRNPGVARLIRFFDSGWDTLTPVSGGSVRLSPNDIRRLDAVFGRFRSSWCRFAECTSKQRLELEWYRDGQLVREDSYVDVNPPDGFPTRVLSGLAERARASPDRGVRSAGAESRPSAE